MGRILFSPSGKIDPDNFMRGAYVLIAVSLLINLLPMVSAAAAAPFKILMLVVAYCWTALFIKRFRDGGKSGWMVFIPIGVTLIAMFIHNSAVPPIFAPEIYANMQEATMEMMSSGLNMSELMAGSAQIAQEFQEPLNKKIALPGSFIYAAWSFAIAYGFNKMIKSV